MSIKNKIAVVIPCYKVSKYIESVIKDIGPETDLIYCIDDDCPENSGEKIKLIEDKRIKVIQRATNGGVGAAVLTGYQAAVKDGAAVIVKLDGDGQMNPKYIPKLISPIIQGKADYVKGNRFYYLDNVKGMPLLRLLGNVGLSFFAKISSGYWNLFDPTNGFTAIHANILKELNHKKIHTRFFFESDILFHLNLLQAVILEAPIKAVYDNEKSNLNPIKCLFQFPFYHLKNLAARLFYNYYLRNFSLASLNLFLGSILCTFGLIFGLSKWFANISKGIETSAGTVMLSALPIIIGFHMLISFLSYDMGNIPKNPIHRQLTYNKDE